MAKNRKKRSGRGAATRDSSRPPEGENDPGASEGSARPAESDAQDLSSATCRRAVGVILILAAAMRLQLILRAGLWLDEIYVLQNVRKPFAENLNTLHWVHFLALKPFLAIGESDFLLRLPAFLFGMALIPLGYATAARLFDRTTGLVWAAALAFAPWFINFSVECKYYSHMMFQGMLGLYFVSLLISTRRLRYLPPVLLIAPLGLYVHPFFGLYYGIFLALLAGHILTDSRYFSPPFPAARFFSRPLNRWMSATVPVVIFGAILAVAGKDTAPGRIAGLAASFLSRLSFGAHPENVEFSFHFFHAWFNETGPSFYHVPRLRPLVQVLAGAGNLILIPLFLAGLAAGFRTCRFITFLISAQFVISFVLLFNLDAGRFFSSRYYSNLVPLYWLGVSVGLVFLTRRIPAGRTLWGRPARIVALFVPLIPVLPQYLFLLFGRHGNWDRVMPVFLRESAPEEKVLYSNWAEQTLIPFYMERYDAGAHPLIKLDHTDRRGPITASQLREHCIGNDSLWFFSSWLDIKSDEAVRWADGHLRKVAEGSSIFAPSNRVTLYHWSGGDRFVPRGRVLHFTPEVVPAGTSSRWNEQFTFEEPGRYRISAQFPAAIEERVFSLTVGETVCGPGTRGPQSGDPSLSWETDLSGGRQTFTLISNSGDVRPRKLTITPLSAPGGIRIPATDAFEIYPTIWTWTPPEDDHHVLCLKRNTFAGFRFGVAESGPYRIEIEGRHDKPAPVLLDLEINGLASGVFSFSDNNDQWSRAGTTVNLSEGNHHLRINFLNEGDVWAQSEDQDRDGWVRGIRVLPAASSQAADDLVIRSVGSKNIPLVNAGGTALAGDWVQASGSGVRTGVYHDPELREVVFSALVEPDSPGVHYASPPIRPSEGGLIYYSALLRADELMNHSVNLRTHFFDAQGRDLGSSIVNQEGIYYSSGWVRFVELEQVASGADSYRIVLWCYPNSTRKSEEAGSIYLARVSVQNAVIPAAGTAQEER